MKQPREPKFYPNEVFLPLNASESTEKTLQSIDSTLKHIEAILLELKSQFKMEYGDSKIM